MKRVKHTLLYLLAAGAMLLTGCSDDFFGDKTEQHDSNRIQLSGDIDQLAEHRIRLINGAGSIGLMRSVADAVLKNGGEVTGVIPRFMVEQNWHHTGLTELIEVESMHERKRKMADLSDGIIALPGGCGTLEELLEIITWKQLGLYLNPIVILNINGFFDPLLEMLEKAIDENFMRRQHGDIWKVAQTPEEAVQLLYETPVWDISIRKFAAI